MTRRETIRTRRGTLREGAEGTADALPRGQDEVGVGVWEGDGERVGGERSWMEGSEGICRSRRRKSHTRRGEDLQGGAELSIRHLFSFIRLFFSSVRGYNKLL